MKRQIIKQIKSELHMLEVSSLPNEFEKHLYAIETLTRVLKEQGPGGDGTAGEAGSESAVQNEQAQPEMTEKDKKMLELMGGSRDRTGAAEEKQTSDSIFDF